MGDTNCQPQKTWKIYCFVTDREISADWDFFFYTFFWFSSDLSNMYQLLKPIHGGLGVLILEVETHIKNTGLEAVKNLKGENVSYIHKYKHVV